ncbi:MAG: beta-lactamase hydrolase domain-containing protein [Burkholderiaceae bacterium]
MKSPAILPLACASGVALAAAMAPAQAQAQDAAAPQPAPSRHSQPAAATAWHEPRPGLLTGGQPAPADWAALEAQGVGMVVNLRPAAEMAGRNEAAEVAGAGMAYVGIPVAGPDAVDADNARRLWTLLKSTPGPVFVHCASGNRAGALLALGAAQSGGMAPEAALEFGRKAGLGSLEPVVRERLGLPAKP